MEIGRLKEKRKRLKWWKRKVKRGGGKGKETGEIKGSGRKWGEIEEKKGGRDFREGEEMWRGEG